MSRLRNSSKNVLLGIIQQIISLLLTFITRTIFIKYLSIELLGINSLFSNILTVLSIADLGFGTAILYSMYKPVAQKDQEKISALMNFYKKIYNIIAIIVLCVGIIILPFLKYLIKETSIENIYLYYILFLLDSVFSYLLAYKVNIINADQKNYIIKRYTLFFNVLKTIFQCLAIIILRNFLIYIVIQIFFTLITNLYGAYITRKMYPFINSKNELDKSEKQIILNNVKSLFIYKIGGVILNNTDNILISSLLGVTIVGYYTNYSTIISAITSITTMIFSTVTYSVGNLIVSENMEKQYEIFKKIDFFCSFLFSFGAICLIVLINDLIKCWIGTEYIINFSTVIAIIINFYMVGVLNSIFMFRDTTGLFNNLKFLAIITAVLNIFFSIILGKIWGLFGIVIATAISRLLTNFWYEPRMLYKLYFKRDSKEYLHFRLKNILFTIILSTILLLVFNKFIISNWITLIIKTICVSVCTIIFLCIVYLNNDEYKYYKELTKNIILKLKIIKVNYKK